MKPFLVSYLKFDIINIIIDTCYVYRLCINIPNITHIL